MGAASGRCCSVATPAKNTDRRMQGAATPTQGRRGSRRLSVIPSLMSVKNYKDFKLFYEERGPLKKGSSVTSVLSKELETKFACRKLPLSAAPCNDLEQIGKHMQALSGLEHPHICKFIDCFEDGNHLYLLYEQGNSTTLFDHILERGFLAEEEAADYLRQAAMALSVAHSQGVCHGRLSPRSIILSPEVEDEDEDYDTQLKICDMGQGCILRPPPAGMEELPKSMEAENYFTSPESVVKDLRPGADGELPKGAEKHDVWALGVIFFHMLSGVAPFKAQNRTELRKLVDACNVTFQGSMWKKLSPAARDVVESMMRVNPAIRLSAASVLKHPWVKVAKTTFPRKRMVKLLGNLQKNVEECEFKRFVLRVIAEQLPRDGKAADTVEQAFRCLDKNGDGVLNIDEVVSGIKKHLSISPDNQQLEDMFAALDRDGSGTINVQEFICASMDQSRSTTLPVLWEAFNAFDRDQSGAIDPNEVVGIVREVEGNLLSIDQVNYLAGTIQSELTGALGSNGRIDFDDFVYILHNPCANHVEAMKRDLNRILWEKCGVDAYKVRHKKHSAWDFSKVSRASRSVYRRKSVRKRAAEVPMLAG